MKKTLRLLAALLILPLLVSCEDFHCRFRQAVQRKLGLRVSLCVENVGDSK